MEALLDYVEAELTWVKHARRREALEAV